MARWTSDCCSHCSVSERYGPLKFSPSRIYRRLVRIWSFGWSFLKLKICKDYDYKCAVGNGNCQFKYCPKSPSKWRTDVKSRLALDSEMFFGKWKLVLNNRKNQIPLSRPGFPLLGAHPVFISFSFMAGISRKNLNAPLPRVRISPWFQYMLHAPEFDPMSAVLIGLSDLRIFLIRFWFIVRDLSASSKYLSPGWRWSPGGVFWLGPLEMAHGACLTGALNFAQYKDMGNSLLRILEVLAGDLSWCLYEDDRLSGGSSSCCRKAGKELRPF